MTEPDYSPEALSYYLRTKLNGPDGRRGPTPRGVWKGCPICGRRFYVRQSMSHYIYCSKLCMSFDYDLHRRMGIKRAGAKNG